MNSKTRFIQKSLFVILLSFFTSNVWSQVEQPGVVLEYNEKLAKTPLGNVEIQVSGAGQRVSAEDGTFTLRFRTKKVGEHVEVQEISKLDYEIFNRDAIDQWNITGEKRPFTIVMCKSSRFKKIKDNLNKVSSESYAKQFKKEQEKLNAERKAGNLKEVEYQKRLQTLQDEFDKQTESIRPYIDRFARIDLSELSEKEQEIILLIQKGETDRAIEEYKKLDLERKVLNNRQDYKKLEEASEAINDAKQKKQEELDSLVAQVGRKNDALILIGGEENLKTVENSYRQIAESDTSYLYGLSAYSTFLFERGRDQENLRYLHLIIQCGKKQFPQYLSSMYHSLGFSYLHLGRYAEAKKYFEKSKEANELYNKEDTQTYLENLAFYYGDLAYVAELDNDYESQGQFLTKEVKILRNLVSINSKKHALGLSMALQMLLQYEAKHNPDQTGSIIAEINSLLDKDSDADIDDKKGQEAFLLFNIANTSLIKGDSDNAIKLFVQLEKMLKPLYQKDKEKYNWYGKMLAMMGLKYAEQNKRTEAQHYLESALSICENDPKKDQDSSYFSTYTLSEIILANVKSEYGHKQEAEALFIKAWMNILKVDSLGLTLNQQIGIKGEYFTYMFKHYIRFNDKKKAEEYLHKLEDLDEEIEKTMGEGYGYPNIWSVYYNLALICYEQKRYKEAEKYSILCLFIPDDNVTESEMQAVRFFLIESLSEQGKYDDGLKYVELFLETVKGEERLHCLHAKGVFLLKKGNKEKARAVWNEIKDKVDGEIQQWSILKKTFEKYEDGNK